MRKIFLLLSLLILGATACRKTGEILSVNENASFSASLKASFNEALFLLHPTDKAIAATTTSNTLVFIIVRINWFTIDTAEPQMVTHVATMILLI